MRAVFACLPLFLLFGCGQKKQEVDSVAIVDGIAISRQQFYDYLERKPSVIVATEGGNREAKVAYTLGFQALRDLVNRRLLLRLAEEQKVAPSSADIESEIENRRKADPVFVKRLTSQGLTMDDIREDIRMDLIQERLWTKGVEVTAAEVDRYIKDHPEEFVVPAKAKLLWIVVENKEQQALIDKALAGGKAFSDVAKTYSLAPGARENGGAFPEERLELLPAEVRQMLEKTPPKESTEWFRSGERLVKIHVADKQPSKQIAIDEDVREKVRRMLLMQKGQQRNNIGAQLQEAIRKAKVEVKDESLRGIWDQATRNLGAAR